MKGGFLKDFYHGVDTYDNNANIIYKVLTDNIILNDNDRIDINKVISEIMTAVEATPHVDLNPYATGYFNSPDNSADSYTDAQRLFIGRYLSKILNDIISATEATPHVDLNPYATGYFNSPNISSDSYTDTQRLL